MKRRVLSFLLCLGMIFTSMPMSVLAEEGNVSEYNMETEENSVSGNTVVETVGETITVTTEYEGLGSVYDVVPQNTMLFSLRDNNAWDATTNTYYGQLDEDSKAVYDELKAAYASEAKTDAVSLTLPEISIEGGASLTSEQESELKNIVGNIVNYAFLALIYDEPEMSWLVNVTPTTSYQLSVTTSDNTNYQWEITSATITLQQDNNFYYTAETLNTAIASAKAEIDTTLNGSNVAYDKVKAIHDYICKEVTYADGDLSLDAYQTAHSALTGDKITVCAGYAKAFKILCDEYKIPCVLVSGIGGQTADDQENHMWNYVQLNGNWYAVDCTWDDQAEKGIYYDFFMVGSDTAASEGFGGGTFGNTHTPSGLWSADLSQGFSYPQLSAEKYTAPAEEELLDVVWVNGSRQNFEADVTGDGTEGNPYNDLETALQKVKSGGTIKIKESITTPQTQDLPLNITKPVTITGGTISCNYAGIVLGADVTLKDIDLSFNNGVRNAIIANGYTLNLENVKSTGTFDVNLFCGAITEAQNTCPEAGDSGEIIIDGTNNKLGDIYAGNFSDLGADVSTVASHFNGNATITFENTVAGEFGNIYVYGAREDRQIDKKGEMWTGNNVEENFTVNGTVKINLYGSNVQNVYGASDKKAHVTFDSASLIDYRNFENIGTLEVNGNLKPTALNNGVDIILNDGGELDLTAVMVDNTFTVGDFIGGTAGGILLIGESATESTPDTLNITGTISGVTKIQTESQRPGDKSTSGRVTDGHAYIKGNSANSGAEFAFEPNAGQSGATLEYVNGAWTASVPESEYTLSKFDIVDSEQIISVSKEDINTGTVSAHVECEFNSNYGDLSCIPLEIVVNFNGQDYAATNIGTDGGYNYCISDLGINIYGTMDDNAAVFDMLVLGKCIEPEPHLTHSDIAPGTYTIKITADTTEQGSVTETITLTVTDPTQPTIPDATLNPATPGNNGWYKEAYLVAPTGYTISDTENGNFDAQMRIANGTHTSIPYWLKSDSDSSVVSKTYIGTVNTDSVPPQISSVTFDEITYNSAILSVTASDSVSGIAKYTLTCTNADGAAPIIGAFVPTNDGGTDSGTFTVTGMEPNTTYTFKIVVEDNAGNSFSMSGGDDLTVTTAKMSLAGATVALKDGVSYTYDGLAKEPSVSDLTVTLNGNEIPLNNTDYVISYGNNINAGNLANITITASDSNPTYTGAASGTFTISKCPLTATVQNQTLTYGDNPSVLINSVVYSGFVNGETDAVVSGAPVYSTNYVQYGDVTGTYTITASMENVVASNYNITVVPGSLTINPLPVTLSWSGHTGRTYGDGQKVTATVSNLLNNDAVQVTVENGNQTAVGTHTAKAVGLTGAKAVNYTLTGTVTEQAYTIAKAAALTGISAEKKVRYTESIGELQLAELLLTNVGNPRITAATEKTDSNNILSGVTFTAGSISYTLGTLTNANVDDTAQIEVTVTSDTHEDITAAVTIQVVDKYVVDDKLTLTIADMPYGTSPAPAGSLTGTAQGQPVEGFTYKMQGEDAYQTLEALQNSSGYLPAGTYLVKYAYEDDEQIGTKTATFQVNPKALTVQVSVSGVTKEYDRTTTVSGTEQPQLIISGCVGSETAVLDNSNVVFQYADYNAGTNKTITASGIKLAAGEPVNENYTIADTASGAGAVIVPKNVTINPDKAYTKVYGSLDPAIAYQAEGLLTGDSISGSLKKSSG